MGNYENTQLRDLGRVTRASSDAFDQLIADGTTNRGDLASHFRYTPEAYRFYKNGTRQLLQYDTDFLDTRSNGDIDDTSDTFTLTPGAGDRMVFQTAERFRYVVAYESEFSIAWQANRALQDGEQIEIYFDGAKPNNGFGNNAHGIRYTADTVEQFIRRDGTEVRTKAANQPRPVTAWSIYKNQFNWYNVGQKRGEEVYSAGDEQQITDLGTISTDLERGPEIGNGRITIDVTADTASDLVVDVGSMGFKNLGQVTPKTRQKVYRVESSVSTANTYEPVAALRTAEGFDLVTVDISGIVPVSTQGDTDFVALAIDPSETDASGFERAPEFGNLASAVESTTNVTELPDETGAIQTSTDTPGGYQIGFGNSESTGSGSNKSQVATARERRRRLHDTDVAVIVADADSTGDIEFLVFTEQEF